MQDSGYIQQYSHQPVRSHRTSPLISVPITSHSWVTVQQAIRSGRMKQSPYRERDYAFGQAMLTLRTTIGLTQVVLADFLGITRRTVGEWEAGSSYPKPEHLKHYIALAIKHGAFPAGREAEEIHTLWQAARQKVLLSEAWLATLLMPQSAEESGLSASVHIPPVRPVDEARRTIPNVTKGVRRLDWGDALSVPTFYWRWWEPDPPPE